jgi:hypothetical protein
LPVSPVFVGEKQRKTANVLPIEFKAANVAMSLKAKNRPANFAGRFFIGGGGVPIRICFELALKEIGCIVKVVTMIVDYRRV